MSVNARTKPLELQSVQVSSTEQQSHAHLEAGAEADGQVDDNNHQWQQLPPIDGGIAAWKLLFGAFMVEALVWGTSDSKMNTICTELISIGFPMCFGVFQNYYFENEPFRGNKNIPIAGTCSSAIAYLGAPFFTPLVKRYQRYQIHMIWIGWPICIFALIGASFAKSIGTLIFTQGVLYGFGALILYYPMLSMVNEWFVQKRGLAYGILCCATGINGIVMPFIIEVLLKKYGYQTTLRAVAISLVVLTGPMIPMLKGRLPASHQNATGKTDLTFFKKPLFYLYATSNFCQAMGYFFPALYLPSYATSIGLGPTVGALLLALVSLAQVLGQLTFGVLSDTRVPLHFLIFLSPFISAIAALTLWGLARSLAPLIVFSLTYGFFAAGYVVLWARMGTTLSEDPTAALATFSVFAFGKGVGNVLAGPISAGLISQITSLGDYGVLRYKGVVIFTGVCMFLSSLSVGAWYINPRKLWANSTWA